MDEMDGLDLDTRSSLSPSPHRSSQLDIDIHNSHLISSHLIPSHLTPSGAEVVPRNHRFLKFLNQPGREGGIGVALAYGSEGIDLVHSCLEILVVVISLTQLAQEQPSI